MVITIRLTLDDAQRLALGALLNDGRRKAATRKQKEAVV